MRINGLLLAASLAGMMAACGQKGPLVLPDKQRPHKKIVLPKPRTPSASQAPGQGAPSSATPPTSPSAPASAAPTSPAPPPSEGAPTPQPSQP